VVRRVYQALANYSRTAVGGGELVAFDFDLGAFAETYRLKAVDAHHALKMLEQQGFVQLTEAVNQPARVQLISNQQDLYQFQVANAQHDQLIKALLRLYGGELFVAFQAIMESALARHLRQSTTDVVRQLRYLHSTGVLHYQPRRELPQALFLTPRYDAAQLPLDERRLRAAKQLTEHQTTAVIDYAASTTHCRQQQLLDYFAEPDAPACGVCDVCLARKKAAQVPASTAGLQAGLLELLRAAPLLPRQVVARYPVAEASAITSALRELVELGRLAYAADGRLGPTA
jgi:ATP-dependent DNA helicase RecQ